jgi:hypothetical protein
LAVGRILSLSDSRLNLPNIQERLLQAEPLGDDVEFEAIKKLHLLLQSSIKYSSDEVLLYFI